VTASSQPPRDRLGCATLLVGCVGCLTVLAGFGALLLAWSALVSLVMVVGAARDGRRVSRAAVAALVVSVVGPIVLYGVLPALLRAG
jgi:hypothetical protein